MAKQTGRTIFHVEFKAGGHHYFGSIAAIYTVFDEKTLGVTNSRLYDYNIEEEKPYSNKVCTIRKAHIIRKPGNRTKPTNF